MAKLRQGRKCAWPTSHHAIGSCNSRDDRHTIGLAPHLPTVADTESWQRTPTVVPRPVACRPRPLYRRRTCRSCNRPNSSWRSTQYRQGARSRNSTKAPRARRRGDRLTARLSLLRCSDARFGSKSRSYRIATARAGSPQSPDIMLDEFTCAADQRSL